MRNYKASFLNIYPYEIVKHITFYCHESKNVYNLERNRFKNFNSVAHLFLNTVQLFLDFCDLKCYIIQKIQ